MVNKINLEVTEQVAHLIMDCLAQKPYIQVAPVINDLYKQIEIQNGFLKEEK